MQVIIGGTLQIINPPPKIKTLITKALTLQNPLYQMTLRMVDKDPSRRRMLFAIKPVIKYYELIGNTIITGRGFAEILKRIIIANNLQCEYVNERVAVKLTAPLPSKVVLRDYQVGIDDIVLAKKQGILKLSTAWGKTIEAFKLIERTQLKTLIICCKSEANELSKYVNDFKKIYDQDIGVIQGKNYDVKDITVATMSTLVKRDLNKLGNEFGMLIVDEVQAGMSDKRRHTIGQFNAERLYGMSGTPGRANNQGEALTFTYGEILVENSLPQDKPDIEVYTNHTEIIGCEYYEMENFACESEARNKMIADIVNDLYKQGRKILLLTKRIEHGKLLKEMLDDKATKIALSSNDNAKERSELIQELRDEKKHFDILIGTYSLFSTGLDIPIIDTVVLGMSTKVDGDYDATLVQSIGRCLRIYKDKNKPLIIDIDDRANKIMHRHFNSRLKVYKRENFNIIYK